MCFLPIVERWLFKRFIEGCSLAVVKSIRACELSEWSCVIALALLGETAVYYSSRLDLSVMVRSDGLPTRTKADLVLLHQCDTVLATLRVYQISSCGMPTRLLAVTILGSISANVPFLRSCRTENAYECFMCGGDNVFLRNPYRNTFSMRRLFDYRTVL